MEKDPIDKALELNLCPRCLTQLKPMNIHGHTTCTTCNCVIADCCEGEQAQKEDDV